MHSEANHIFFEGPVKGDFLPASAALHNLIHKQGYQDITLDFAGATFLEPSYMLPLVAACRAYRKERVGFDIVMPSQSKQAALLRNTNWAHLIDPEKFEKSQNDITHLAARQFMTADDQYRAVDDSLQVMLGSLPGIDRTRLKALEWALNEITDNVLNHSESPIGGIAQVVTFATRKRVEFYVADAGVTIPRSLRSGHPEMRDDTSALRAAVEEGVTRNAKTNQGNGLFGTFKCCEVSGGEFDIISGTVTLRHRPGELSVTKNSIPFQGTYVRASIGYDYEKLLEKALVFRGRPHNPSSDFVERIYNPDGDIVRFVVGKELSSFGNRESGRIARTKVENLMDSFRVPIEFDFKDVRLITSSFADEVFGKLFQELGAIRFTQLCHFKNVDNTVRGLIDRAISQRAYPS